MYKVQVGKNFTQYFHTFYFHTFREAKAFAKAMGKTTRSIKQVH